MAEETPAEKAKKMDHRRAMGFRGKLIEQAYTELERDYDPPTIVLRYGYKRDFVGYLYDILID